MQSQKSQPTEAEHLVPPPTPRAPMGPLGIWLCHPPARAHAHEIHVKAGGILITRFSHSTSPYGANIKK